MARLGPRFRPPKSPEKVYVYVPLLRSFQEMRHINFFLGAQNRGLLCGGQKVYVEKVYVLFLSLKQVSPRGPEKSGKVSKKFRTDIFETSLRIF